jgi:hypothetical protein
MRSLVWHFFVFGCAGLSASAGDWPQWRGIHRDLTAEGRRFWRAGPKGGPRGSGAWSSRAKGSRRPVVAGGTVYDGQYAGAKNSRRVYLYALAPETARSAGIPIRPGVGKELRIRAHVADGERRTDLCDQREGFVACVDAQSGKIICGGYARRIPAAANIQWESRRARSSTTERSSASRRAGRVRCGAGRGTGRTVWKSRD